MEYNHETSTTNEATSAPQPKFCPNCGTQFIYGARFCQECGLAADLVSSTSSSTTAESAPVNSESQPIVTAQPVASVPSTSTTASTVITSAATPTATRDPHRGKAIASMVLGIIGVVFCLVPILSLILSLVGLPLALSSRSTTTAKGMMITGIVCNAIALLISIIILIGLIVGLSAFRYYF